MGHHERRDRPRSRHRDAKEIHFPHSLGLLYAAFTYYTGFKVNSGEYKVMGLAPYGEPRYAGIILDQFDGPQTGRIVQLNQEYFDYCVGLRMTNDKFRSLFGGPPRAPDELLEQRHMDLAASVQAVIDEAIVRMVRRLVAERPVCASCAWPAELRSIASPTAKFCATERSMLFGFSRLPGMPAARLAPRLLLTTNFSMAAANG